MELALVGIFVGFLSGFFGIGGGTILVPILLALGFNMKSAVGISVTQMVFSSLFGSFLNLRKGVLKIREGLAIGLGGALGALGSGLFLSMVDDKVLEWMFLFFVLFAMYRFYKAPVAHQEPKEVPKLFIFFVGVVIGLLAISIGVGGSILVAPILVGFFGFDVKKAASMGLFFVIFSSISGFLSLSLFGHIDYFHGFIVGLSSLIGVYFGIHLAHKMHRERFKKLLSIIYTIILILVIRKIFFVG